MFTSHAADPPSKTPGALGEEPEKNMRLIFTGEEKPEADPALAKYGMYEKSAPRPDKTDPVETALLQADVNFAGTCVDRVFNQLF